MDSLRTRQLDRPFFWANLQGIRPLTKIQVAGIEDILNHYDDNAYDMTLGGLASYLGQAGTETPDWQPIRELGKMSYFKYLIGKGLGVDNMREAWMFRGWGRVQTTGETGFYRAVGIINAYLGFKRFGSPHELGEWLLDKTHDKQAESEYDLIVSFTCCSKGLYTGRKFNDFTLGDGGYDFYNARKVVNPGQITAARKYPNGHHARMLNQIVHDSKVFYNALRFVE